MYPPNRRFRNDIDRSPWLTLNKVYTVLSLSFSKPVHTLRLIGDEQNGVALFGLHEFELVSSIIPPTWIISRDAGGIIQLAPEEWIRPGFWEQYYNQDYDAVRVFNAEVQKIVEAEG